MQKCHVRYCARATTPTSETTKVAYNQFSTFLPLYASKMLLRLFTESEVKNFSHICLDLLSFYWMLQ